MDYQQILDELAHNVCVIRNPYEQEILLKKVPDAEQGGLDPRAVANAEKPSPFEGHAEGKLSLEFLRSIMGWDNHDVTQGAIERIETEIPTPNGSVRAFVYGMEMGKQKPCLLFYHGGGFFGGSLKCVENPCKAIAQYGSCVVVSVEYALAPENPFPAGLEDCYAALCYVHTHPEEFGADASKIGVCGDSAGGNLATVCALRDADDGLGMVRFEALLYPVVNVSAMENEWYTWDISEYEILHHREYTEEAVRALGRNPQMLVDVYLTSNTQDAKKRYVSPLFADLGHMPATLIVNAEYDFLRLEGEAYGRKLAAEGVPVTMMRYAGMDHAFMDKIGEYPQAEDCMREIGQRFLAVVSGQEKV